MAVGLAQAALDASIPYAQTREQFGRPIGTFQGVAFMIADMATEIEAARALVWRAAWLKDQGRDYGLAAAQAKLFASEVSSRATNNRDPGPRRLRLRRGVQGRALPARREADRDRGGDEPGPAARDRAQDPRPARRLNEIASLEPRWSDRDDADVGSRPRRAMADRPRRAARLTGGCVAMPACGDEAVSAVGSVGELGRDHR